MTRYIPIFKSFLGRGSVHGPLLFLMAFLSFVHRFSFLGFQTVSAERFAGPGTTPFAPPFHCSRTPRAKKLTSYTGLAALFQDTHLTFEYNFFFCFIRNRPTVSPKFRPSPRQCVRRELLSFVLSPRNLTRGAQDEHGTRAWRAGKGERRLFS